MWTFDAVRFVIVVGRLGVNGITLGRRCGEDLGNHFVCTGATCRNCMVPNWSSIHFGTMERSGCMGVDVGAVSNFQNGQLCRPCGDLAGTV